MFSCISFHNCVNDIFNLAVNLQHFQQTILLSTVVTLPVISVERLGHIECHYDTFVPFTIVT